MRFIVDQPLPKLLAPVFHELGQEAIHAGDLGPANLSDKAIWALALERRSVVVTKDEDFRRLLIARPLGRQVLWIRLGNCRNTVLFDQVRRAWPRVRTQLNEGRSLVEVR